MALLEGKTGVVFGVANKRSIAWAIAQALSREGMKLAFTYQGERLKESVEALAAAVPGSIILPCDVTNDAEIDAVYASIDKEWGKLDAVLHSVAFAPKEDLEGEFVNTSRDGFKLSSVSGSRLCHSRRLPTITPTALISPGWIWRRPGSRHISLWIPTAAVPIVDLPFSIKKGESGASF